MSETHLYKHFNAEGKLLYVGISLSTITRLSQHKEHSHWFASIARVEILKFASRERALEAERLAIIEENPEHNIKRPKIPSKYTREQEADARAARGALTGRLVRYNPTYSMREAGEVLGISSALVKRLIDAGKLGSISYPTGGAKTKIYITGWQLIDFLEFCEKQDITTRNLRQALLKAR